jgi:hypothetical protein
VLENTLMLEDGKPTMMGVTNMKDALVLVVK